MTDQMHTFQLVKSSDWKGAAKDDDGAFGRLVYGLAYEGPDDETPGIDDLGQVRINVGDRVIATTP